jgi:glycosyltransferase involved in cell wall biosynthesis
MDILYASVIEANAPWGAEIFINNAIRRLGHTTFTIDYRVNRHALLNKLSPVNDFDVFLLQRGDYFPVELVRSIKRSRFFYFSELFAVRRDADKLFSEDVFDHYFVRGDACRNELVQLGWVPDHKISVLLSAVDPATYFPQNIHKDIDVLFVGSMTARRKKVFDQLSQQFSVYTTSAFAHQANELYNRAKIILNIHANQYLDTETRIFEVLATKSFLLTEQLASESPFVSGTHLVELEALDDFAAHVQYFLEHEEERQTIAQRGYEAIIAEHTYDARVQQLLGTIERVSNAHFAPSPPIAFDELRVYALKEHLFRYTARSKVRLKRVVKYMASRK